MEIASNQPASAVLAGIQMESGIHGNLDTIVFVAQLKTVSVVFNNAVFRCLRGNL